MYTFDQHSPTVESWVPRQHSTPRALRTKVDFYLQRCIKFPEVAAFHSRAELLHAALLESDPAVTSFIPQPLRFHLGSKIYVPDCYFVKNNQRVLREIKAPGQLQSFREKRLPLLESYCAFNQVKFELIVNDWVFEQEVLAENWLRIVRNLANAIDIATDNEEKTLYQKVGLNSGLSLGEIIDVGDREGSYREEIACFRLLHNGRLTADLTQHPLSYDTEFFLCT
ncbi:hypothetical protein NBRC116493_35380 [Aurantivibrio infirmus]